MPKRPICPEDLLKITYLGDPQISPNGERVLFSKKTITEKNKYLGQLCSVDREGRIQHWTQGQSSSSAGRWSPDGSWISFVSGREDETSQLFLISTSGGEAFKLTAFPDGSIGSYCWSPDSAKIALTFRPSIPEYAKAAKKERAEKGLSDAPLVFDDLKYRLDGDGYFANTRYELWILDVQLAQDSSGDPEQCVTCKYSADVHGNYEFDWAPNSKELAVIHSASKRPFADPPNDQIWRLNLECQAWQLEGLPKGTKASPKWSPDGHWIAYAGDVDDNDPWGTRNTKLYLVAADGGEAKDLTGHQDFDLEVATLSDTKEAAFGTAMEWTPDNSGLFVQVGTRGESQLGFASVHGGITLLTEGKHCLTLGNSSGNGTRVAGTLTTQTRLAEIVVIETELATGRWTPKTLTDLNQKWHAEIAVVEPQEVLIPTTDGLELHGWVMKPVDLLEGKRLPAILQIHGGPHAQYGWAFFHEMQCQVAAGYVVLFTNPRGSKGYGEAWTSAIRGNWGAKDWEDIQAATEWMKEQTFIHPGRMAVMGGSYGGYMTNWVIGHSHDFKCAITDRCVSNMVSMAGNSDFPFNKNGYFQGIAWGDLQDIESLWKQSPIAYFKNVKTPTLVIHSAGDLRCNIEQSEQVFTALQQEGVDSRFVRYPSTTSHGMSRSGPPDLRLHRLHEILTWLSKYLK